MKKIDSGTRNRFLKALLLPAACVALSACTSFHYTAPVITAGEETISPIGYRMINETLASADASGQAGLPDFIARELNYPKRVVLPYSMFKDSELEMVKSILDKHFVYKTDKENFYSAEDWRMPSGMQVYGEKVYGDCDDYAILARAMLKQRGINARLLYLKDRNAWGTDQGHLVAEYQGWWLDDRKPHVNRATTASDELVSVLDEEGKTWRAIRSIEATGLMMVTARIATQSEALSTATANW